MFTELRSQIVYVYVRMVGSVLLIVNFVQPSQDGSSSVNGPRFLVREHVYKKRKKKISGNEHIFVRSHRGIRQQCRNTEEANLRRRSFYILCPERG